MADLIQCWGIVEGSKNACRAFLGALPKTDAPEWNEFEKDGNCRIVFQCETKGPTWNVDQSDDSVEEAKIPDDLDDAFNFGQDYFANPPADISKRFAVAFVVWDDWENYWAYDRGEWLSGPLADELESDYYSNSSQTTQSNSNVPAYFRNADYDLLEEIADVFDIFPAEGLYDDMGLTTAAEVIEWLKDRCDNADLIERAKASLKD